MRGGEHRPRPCDCAAGRPSANARVPRSDQPRVRRECVGVYAARGSRIPFAPIRIEGAGAAEGLAMQLFRKNRMWRRHELKPSYDVVIVGAGAHGLAAAYYLGKEHGVRSVALLDKSYLGYGASGRNTAIICSNYRTPEGIPFYDASLKLYEQMSREVGWNVLFSQVGHLTLAHNDSSVAGLRVRAENNQLLGVNSRMIDRDEIQKLAPAMNLDPAARYPVLAALYHPPGGIIRHDAVVWGYARACDRIGIEIHPFTEVTGIKVENNQATTVMTKHGPVSAGAVL